MDDLVERVVNEPLAALAPIKVTDVEANEMLTKIFA